jgi:hypothetical protein
MLKHLRIAVTALSLTVCALLIALWVRSYWYNDAISGDQRSHFIYVGTRCGKIGMLRELINYAHWIPVRSASMPVSADDWHSKLLLPSYAGEPPPHRFLGFRWRVDNDGWRSGCELEAPIFYPVVLFGVLAIAPWRLWRFSLRTLLIATTLFAVALGLIVLR